VSVVVPVHNGERFIAECVRSVLHQTHPVHECIVVDDGSTDATVAALRPFRPEVRVVRQRRAGVAAARNAGMRAAGGDHFAFLDADDVWMPQKVERQLAALAAGGPEAAVYSGYVIADERLCSRRLVLHPCSERSVERALLIEAPGLGFSFTGMTTRAAADRVGTFDERLSTSADLDFAWRLARRCRLIGVREALAVHRQHSKGQMHRDLARLERDMSLVLDAAEATGLASRAARRGRANLETYTALRLVLDGALGAGLTRLLRAALSDPRRPVNMAARAATQRAAQHLALHRAPTGAGGGAPGPGIAAPPAETLTELPV
jgi:glycosyltransferase involved in cell wall biosynthesis